VLILYLKIFKSMPSLIYAGTKLKNLLKINTGSKNSQHKMSIN
jgi:hypothetical protein